MQAGNADNLRTTTNNERKMTIQITEEVATKVLSIVDHGLSSGVGVPKPGWMCVEAAVCYALGLPHGDDPGCVAPSLRSLKIRLNDSNWSSNEARARGLRRLAVAQLGSKDALDEKEFVRRLIDYAIRISTPAALRSAASVCKDEKHKSALCEAANKCEKEGTREAAREAREVARAAADYAYAAAAADDAAAAYAAADAAKKSARDLSLAEYAEAVVQILIDLKAPGCQWLELTEMAA